MCMYVSFVCVAVAVGVAVPVGVLILAGVIIAVLVMRKKSENKATYEDEAPVVKKSDLEST